jgi:hypothetical protein
MISNLAGFPSTGRFTTEVTLVHGTFVVEPEFLITGSIIEVKPAAKGKRAQAAEIPIVDVITNLLEISPSQLEFSDKFLFALWSLIDEIQYKSLS